MFNSLALFIGLRYTGARRRSQLVSFISAVSIFGLALGVGLLIVVLSVMNGFEKELRERILGILPQAALYHREGIEDWNSLRDRLLTDPELLGAAPFVQLQGMVSYRREAIPVIIYGIEPVLEKQISVVERFLPAGALEKLAPGGIILGVGIARQMGIQEGDRVTVVVPRSRTKNRAPGLKALRVQAVINSGTELDNNMGLVVLDTASTLSSFPGRVSGLKLRMHSLYEAPEKVSALVRELPYGYYGSDWTSTHGNLYQAIQISKNLVGLLLFLIIAIAAFNVVSTLVMVVVDKRGDIAILRTLGASSAEIMAVFMVQGSLIGFIGTAIGLLVGVLLSLSVQDLVAWLERALDVQFLKSDVYPISYLPAEMRPEDIAIVAVTALAMSFVATLYPAWRASRVNPAEALRYE